MWPSLNDLGDDPEKFFRRPAFDIGSADLWRWVAARDALRDLKTPTKRDDDGR